MGQGSLCKHNVFSAEPSGHSRVTLLLALCFLLRAFCSILEKGYLRGLGVQRYQLQVSTPAGICQVAVGQLKVQF